MLYQSRNPHGGDIYDGQIDLDFSANTNPFGTPEGIITAVSQALPQMHRYPDPFCRKLIAAIADHEQTEPGQILCGNGAAELIYAYCHAIRPRTALVPAPTLSEYQLGLETVGCQVRHYGLKQENGFSITEEMADCIESIRPDAVFLCNPNNPTGNLIAPSVLDRILDVTRKHRIHLFLDECFLDLCDGGESLKSRLSEHPQLFLLKAFTKSYGMAGIRLGYCLCGDPETLSAMAKATQPWNVSSLAQAAGIAALEEQEFLEKTKRLVHGQRLWLQKELQDLGFWVSDSRTNYLLFKGPVGLHTAMRERRIAIRSCANYEGLGEGWYRIAVRQPEENQKLMSAMRECLEKEKLWQK